MSEKLSFVAFITGGELDILEYANDESNKVTFHTDRACKLNVQKLRRCARKIRQIDPWRPGFSGGSSCSTKNPGGFVMKVPQKSRNPWKVDVREPWLCKAMVIFMGILGDHGSDLRTPR